MKQPSTMSPARYLHLLLLFLEQRDIDCSVALRPLGIDRAMLAHPAAKVPTVPAVAVFQQLVVEHGGPALGLQVGQLLTLGELGEFGRTLLSCSTFGEALGCAETFCAAIAPSFKMQVRRLPHACELTWLPVYALPYDFVLFCFDMALASFDGLLVQMLGEAAPLCVAYLTRAQPLHVGEYRRLQRIRCHFAQPGLPSLRICMPADLWDHPMVMRNPDQLAMQLERLALLTRPLPRSGVVQWVEMMLEQTSGEQPSQALIAQIAGVSISTLSRRLTAEGTTFRQIANRVRHVLACRLLQEEGFAVSEVSTRLGYADIPSFVRAFKAVSGVTPGRYGEKRGRQV